MPLVLRVPIVADEPEFWAVHEATSPGYPSFLHFYEDGMSLPQYLDVLQHVRCDWNLPTDELVPETFLFAFVGDRIVGRTAIRHRLTPALERVGGHIGYVVVPEFRRRGYATEILRLSLGIARESVGLHRVLVTCDDTNVGSIKTIEKNGGVLENTVRMPDEAVLKRRYWIDLGDRGPVGGPPASAKNV